MTRVLVVAVTVAMVVSTGFATVGVSEPKRQDATTESDLPSQVTTPTPQETPNETTGFPPGASEDGIKNATRLVQTHQAALQNTSYTEQSEWEGATPNTTANGTFGGFEVARQTGTVEKGANGTHLSLDFENDSNAYWFTDDATVSWTQAGSSGANSTIYRYSQGQDDQFRNERYLVNFSSLFVEPYLRDLEYNHVETTTRDNRTLHTYASTGIDETVEPDHGDTPVTSTTEDISATVVVSDRGIIHSFTASHTRSFQNETVTTARNLSVDGIGETNATAPGWVSEEIAQFDATLVGNGSAVALTHTDGVAVSNPPLWFSLPNAAHQTTVDGTIEAGDTLYVSVPAGDDTAQSLRTSINDRPAANGSFVSLRGNLSVTAYRNVAGTYDSGVQLEVTMRDHPGNSTARNATAEPPRAAGETV